MQRKNMGNFTLASPSPVAGAFTNVFLFGNGLVGEELSKSTSSSAWWAYYQLCLSIHQSILLTAAHRNYFSSSLPHLQDPCCAIWKAGGFFFSQFAGFFLLFFGTDKQFLFSTQSSPPLAFFSTF